MHYFYLFFFLTLLSTANLTAQSPTDGPGQALNVVFEKGNLMAALSGHEWRPGLSLAAAHLSVGQTISLNVSLLQNVEYVFLASGATEQADVDLYLRDLSGRLLAEDEEEDGTPVIEFKATATGTFQLQLHFAAGESPEAYVALSLLRKGGRQITEQDFRSISTGFFAAAQRVTSSDTGADWQKKVGEWCMFGYSLQGEEGVSLRGLQPGQGKKIFAAAGPESSEITLYLANQEGRIVAGTSRPEAFPLLSYTSPSGTILDLRVGADRSKSHILVLVGVFDQ